MGGCQNYGPFLGTLNIRCRIIIGIQKGTIILTITQVDHNMIPASALVDIPGRLVEVPKHRHEPVAVASRKAQCEWQTERGSSGICWNEWRASSGSYRSIATTCSSLVAQRFEDTWEFLGQVPHRNTESPSGECPTSDLRV